MQVAIVGATGVVGQMMRRVLEERNFPVTRLIPVASERSAGKSVRFKDDMIPVVTVEEALTLKPDWHCSRRCHHLTGLGSGIRRTGCLGDRQFFSLQNGN